MPQSGVMLVSLQVFLRWINQKMASQRQVVLYMGEGVWPGSKFGIGDVVVDTNSGKQGKVEGIVVNPKVSWIFSYWIAGIGHDIPEDELEEAMTTETNNPSSPNQTCPPYTCEYGSDGRCVKCHSHRPPYVHGT